MYHTWAIQDMIQVKCIINIIQALNILISTIHIIVHHTSEMCYDLVDIRWIIIIISFHLVDIIKLVFYKYVILKKIK